jgi:RNA polymerase sigma-70 factor (ECF subfamily)
MSSQDTFVQQVAQSLVLGQSSLECEPLPADVSNPDGKINDAMDRYAAGNAEAFSELYDLIAPRLYGYLFRRARDQSQAEDILQQTMLRIHCARGRFIPGAPVMPWAISIARRLLIDDKRRRKFEVSEEAESGFEPRRTLDAIDCPVDEMMHTKRVAQMVMQELARLPKAQRAAFELVKQDGLSHAEAAQILGTTVTAVKLRAHRTYVRLRMALGELLQTREL